MGEKEAEEEDVLVIRSRIPGEPPIILRPTIIHGVKVLSAPLPGWDRFFPAPKK